MSEWWHTQGTPKNQAWDRGGRGGAQEIAGLAGGPELPVIIFVPLGRDCVRMHFSQRKAQTRKGERDSLLITSQHLDLAGPEAELPLDFSGN